MEREEIHLDGRRGGGGGWRSFTLRVIKGTLGRIGSRREV